MGIYDFAKEFSNTHPFWAGVIVVLSITLPVMATLAAAILSYLKK